MKRELAERGERIVELERRVGAPRLDDAVRTISGLWPEGRHIEPTAEMLAWMKRHGWEPREGEDWVRSGSMWARQGRLLAQQYLDEHT